MTTYGPIWARQIGTAVASGAVLFAGSLQSRVDVSPVRVSHQEIGALGGISPSGREFCFRNGSDLSAWVLATSQTTPITKPAPEAGGFTSTTCTWSPTGDRVAYGWRNPNRTNELRVVDRASGGHMTVAGPSTDSEFTPFAWSPDGQQILSGIRPLGAGNGQLSLVGTVGRTVTVLKQLETGSAGVATFSPDGRFVAYDRRTSRTGSSRDVFVIKVEGNREVSLAAAPEMDEGLLAWLPDGRVLYSSSRSGGVDAWAVSTRDGVPIDAPTRVHTNVSGFDSLGVTSNGRLFVRRIRNIREVLLAEIDPSTGKVVRGPAPVAAQPSDALRKEPAWSPDGNRLAYFENTPGSPETLVVRTVATGESRTYATAILNPDHVQWKDGSAILVDGTGSDGVPRMFKLDLDSGQAASFSDSLVFGLSSDGRYSFEGLRRQAPGLAKRSVSDGSVEMLTTFPIWGARLSPDGLWIAYFTAMRSRASLAVISSSGGAPRVLAKDIEVGYDRLAWTPDSRYVICQQLPHGLHRVALDDGAAQPLGIPAGGDMGNLTELSLNRDGRRLALDVARQTREVQVWSGLVAGR